MDKKIIIIIALSLIILIGGGVYAYNYVDEKAYNYGFQDATLLINQQVINNLIDNGFITIYVPYENSTIPIKLIPEGYEDE